MWGNVGRKTNNTISRAFKRNELVERYFRKIKQSRAAHSRKSNQASGKKSLYRVLSQDKRVLCWHFEANERILCKQPNE